MSDVIYTALPKLAWNAASDGMALTGKDRERYSTLAHRVPAMLRTSGLGQTCAFLFSKQKDKADGLLLRQIQHIIGVEAIMDALTSMNATTYRYHTEQVMQFADWLKRFTAGLK